MSNFWSDYHNFAIQIYDSTEKCWRVLYYCQIDDFQSNGFGQEKSPIDWFFPTTNTNSGNNDNDNTDASSSSSTFFFMNNDIEIMKQKQKQQLGNDNNMYPTKDYPLFVGNPYYSENDDEDESDSDEENWNDSERTAKREVNHNPWNVLRDDNHNDMYLEVTPETTVLSWDEVLEKGANPSIREHYDIIEWFVNLSKFQLYLDPTTTSSSDEYDEEQYYEPQDMMEFDHEEEMELKRQGRERQLRRQQTYDNCLKVLLQRKFPKEVVADNILPFVGIPTHLRKVRIHYSYGNDKEQ